MRKNYLEIKVEFHSVQLDKEKLRILYNKITEKFQHLFKHLDDESEKFTENYMKRYRVNTKFGDIKKIKFTEFERYTEVLVEIESGTFSSFDEHTFLNYFKEKLPELLKECVEEAGEEFSAFGKFKRMKYKQL